MLCDAEGGFNEAAESRKSSRDAFLHKSTMLKIISDAL